MGKKRRDQEIERGEKEDRDARAEENRISMVG